MEYFLEVLKAFGLPTALVVFFLWMNLKREKQDADREKGMTDKINEVEKYTRDKLEGLVTENTIAMTKVSDSSEKITSALSQRPCLKDRVDL